MILSLLILWTLIVIGLGGFTRLMNAGLGCPDWPGCYGHWILPDQISMTTALSSKGYLEAWIEMIHRYAAGLLGSCVIILSLYYLWNRRHQALSLSLIACIVFQALLGMWTVTLKLHPVIVSAHFLGGLTLLMLLTALKVQIHWQQSSRASLWISTASFVKVVFILYLLQILLGAWVSTNYAGLSCPSLLSCPQKGSLSDLQDTLAHTSQIWSATDPLSLYTPFDKAWIQWIHRLNALVLGWSLWTLRSKIWAQSEVISSLGALADSAFFIYCVQILLGTILIWAHLPLSIASLHNICAALLSLPLIAIGLYPKEAA